jgi:CBS domain-containing protein
MFDEPVRSVMQRRKVLKAPPETLVSKAAKLMARRNVGANVSYPETASTTAVGRLLPKLLP